MIKIAGLRALSERLARLDMIEVQQASLQHTSQSLVDAIQDDLSSEPGGNHTAPWRRTGTLQSSISYRSDATRAAIGSDDPTAVDQELGTREIPPRPFLSKTAANLAAEIVQQIVDPVAAQLRDAAKDTTS